ncbi:MAG TPA: hypothetical protein VFZ34_30455 [Blastocatellia bacterium]|nr:hypothetical protein [Blastocatellia bacterium]
MQPRERLSSLAVDHCRDAASQRIKGEVFVEVNSSEVNWDSLKLRHVFEQQMTIWRKYGGFEVIMDEAGEVVGFVDHDKYLKSVGGILSEDDAKLLVKKARILPTEARLIRLREHKIDELMRTFRATFVLPEAHETHSQVEVEINSTTRDIIAVRPIPKKEKPHDGV